MRIQLFYSGDQEDITTRVNAFLAEKKITKPENWIVKTRFNMEGKPRFTIFFTY